MSQAHGPAGRSPGLDSSGGCPASGHRGSGLSQYPEHRPGPWASSGCVWVGRALTEVKGGACVGGAEPDQGQQHEAGGQQQGQQVEQQQEAKEGEVGLDPGAEEAYGGRREPSEPPRAGGPAENPRAVGGRAEQPQ